MATEKAKKTAEKIKAAATKLFGRYGFYNVSIKQIAAEAGTNTALISYYFGGKQQLYAAVIAQQYELIEKLQARIKKEKGSALTQLYSYLEGIMKAQLNKSENINLIYREVLTPTGMCDLSINNFFIALHNFTKDLLKAAIKEKSIKPLDDESAAAFIMESITVLIFLVRNPLAETFGNKVNNYDEALKNIIASYLEPYLTK